MRTSEGADSPNLARAADLLDSTVTAVLSAFAEAPPTGYEADVEANLMIHLGIRDAEGVALLAREGSCMYPAAMVLTRAAYESALRALWMMHPDDPSEREGRYLAPLEETERLAKVAAREFNEMGAADSSVKEHVLVAEQIREFRQGVASKLPAGVTPPTSVPRPRDMIAESGFTARYLLNKFGCQYVHATNYATGIYRRHLGDAMEIGEFIEPKMWTEPLHLAWWSLQAPTVRLLDILGPDSKAFPASVPASEMKEIITALDHQGSNPAPS